MQDEAGPSARSPSGAGFSRRQSDVGRRHQEAAY